MLGLATAGGQGIILGVLEDVPGSYFGEKNWPGVRAVFHKDSGGQWTAYPTDCTEPDECAETAKQFPAGQHWTIGFDGKKIGDVSSKTIDSGLGAHIGLQGLVDGAEPPHIGKPSTEFGGFGEDAVYRPLIANTQPYVSDPDLWKRSEVSPDLLAGLRRAFRQKYPRLCRITTDDSNLAPFPYQESAVFCRKGYHSRSGWWLARLHLDKAIDCNDTEAGFQLDDPWFVVNPAGQTTYLASGMFLVDAGDYDNDGHSELVFAIDRYNRGGYILYWADFSKSATFAFTYH